MRPKGNNNHLERRRNTAIDLLQKGLSVQRISKRMRISPCSIYRWRKLFVQGGYMGLVPKKTPGRPRKLTEEQKYQLIKILFASPQQFGKKYWSIGLVQKLVSKKFNINYNTAHVWRLLKQMDWKYEQGYLPDFLEKRGVKLYPHYRGKWKHRLLY